MLPAATTVRTINTTQCVCFMFSSKSINVTSSYIDLISSSYIPVFDDRVFIQTLHDSPWKWVPLKVNFRAEWSYKQMMKCRKSRISTLTVISIIEIAFCGLKLGLKPGGLQVTQAWPGWFFGKPVSHSLAQPSLKEPGSVRWHAKSDRLAGLEYSL